MSFKITVFKITTNKKKHENHGEKIYDNNDFQNLPKNKMCTVLGFCVSRELRSARVQPFPAPFQHTLSQSESYHLLFYVNSYTSYKTKSINDDM